MVSGFDIRRQCLASKVAAVETLLGCVQDKVDSKEGEGCEWIGENGARVRESIKKN